MTIRCPQCGKVLNAPDGTEVGVGKCPHCSASVDLATAERVGLNVGDVVSGCRVDALVGRGGMAVVYRATQLSLDRPVALKVLAQHLARRSSFLERFEREATALAQLSHPNIVNILDKGAQGGTYFFVMEFVEGEALRDRLRRDGKLPFPKAVRLFQQAASGLQYAHDNNVLHRDIKPENILITGSGDAKLADFGIARIAGDDPAAGHRLTTAQTRMGTAHYMAPEQVRDAGSVDHRADIYALGVTLYEMLTGELPIGQFKRASQLGTAVPTAVDRVISKALAARPEERFQSVGEFRAALDQASTAPVARQAEDRGSAARSWRVGALVAAAALLAIGVAVAALGPWRSIRPSVKAEPEQPREPDPREKKAGELMARAYQAVALRKWGEAKGLLAELQRDFADTKCLAENKNDITALDREVAAALLPPEPPKATEAPKAKPEPKPQPQPEPKTPEKAEPKAEPQPKTEPEPKPPPKQEPPEPKELTLFDGTSLDGWRVAELGFGPRKTESVKLADGHALMDGGKRGIGMVWTGKAPKESYELAVEAMRTDGQSPFAYLIFPVGEAGCSLVLGSQAGSGLDAVDGLPANRNETRRDVAFQNDEWYRFTIRVTPTRVEVRVGQNQMVAMARGGHEFAVPQWCDAYKPLGIVAWRGTLAVRSVRLRRLTFAPPRIVKAEPAKGEELLVRLKPLWANRSYDAALAEARTAVGDAKDPETREAAEAIGRAAELLPRLWKLVAAGAGAMKDKTLTVKGVTGKIAGVKGDSLVLAVGPGAEVSRKLATLDATELLELAKAGADPANADDHLALALFAAFDEAHDMALARKELAAAKAAGGDASDATAVLALAAVPAFRKAIAAAKLRLDAGDLAGAKKLVAEAQKLKPAGPEATCIVESSLQFLLAQALTACKAVDFSRANDLADLAAMLDPKHPDIEKLTAWVKANVRPTFVETFDGPRLDRWDVESGFWRIASGRLVVKTAFQDVAQVFLHSAGKQGFTDFALTFEVGNSSDARAFRFGVLFREQQGRKREGAKAGQFLYCLLSGTHSLLCAGGATAYNRFPIGVVDGVRFRYTRPEPLRMGGQSFPVDVGKLYRMAVRCQANSFECYINDQLVVEGVTGVADSGRIGFLVQGGECVFDNVKLYTPAPLPDLTLFGGETEIEE